MASYKQAIRWLADNDDNEYLKDAIPIPSVGACLVADLFDKIEEKVMKDVKRQIAKDDETLI